MDGDGQITKEEFVEKGLLTKSPNFSSIESNLIWDLSPCLRSHGCATAYSLVQFVAPSLLDFKSSIRLLFFKVCRASSSTTYCWQRGWTETIWKTTTALLFQSPSNYDPNYLIAKQKLMFETFSIWFWSTLPSLNFVVNIFEFQPPSTLYLRTGRITILAEQIQQVTSVPIFLWVQL